MSFKKSSDKPYFCRCFALSFRERWANPLLSTGKTQYVVIGLRRGLRFESQLFCLCLLCPLLATEMESKVDTDDLEMRVQVLESRVYGERRNKSGKPIRVCSKISFVGMDGGIAEG